MTGEDAAEALHVLAKGWQAASAGAGEDAAEALCRSLLSRVGECAERVEARGLAQCAWAAGALSAAGLLKGGPPLAAMHAIERRAGTLATSSFNAVDAAQWLHGLGKTGWAPEPRSLSAVLARVRVLCRERSFGGRELSMALWALASLRTERAPDAAAVRDLLEAAQASPDLNAQGVATALWAASKLIPSPDEGARSDETPTFSHETGEDREEAEDQRAAREACVELARICLRIAADLTPQGISAAATGAARLAIPGVVAELVSEARPSISDMAPQDVADVGWALAVVGGEGLQREWAALATRARAVAPNCGWRQLGLIHYALSRAGRSATAAAALGERLPSALAISAASADALDRAAIDAFLRLPKPHVAAAHLRRKGPGRGNPARLLLVNPCRGCPLAEPLQKRLEQEEAEAGGGQGHGRRRFRVRVWRRFAMGSRAGSEWAPEGSFDACLMRLPSSTNALKLAVAAVATRLAPGAPLWICGARSEGVHGAAVTAALAPYFESITTAGEGVLSSKRSAKAAHDKGGLESFRRERQLSIGDGRLPWITFESGLFADGGLDPMTALLLRALGKCTLAPRARVLDFACGSGIIGAALLSREPTLRVTAADADAVALAAAKLNLASDTATVECVASDRFRALRGGKKSSAAADAPTFDLIVSNPPVHRGLQPDLAVLESLCAEAPALLARGAGGRLVLVAQAYVPAGVMLEGAAREAGEHAKVELLEADKRFAVWQLTV